MENRIIRITKTTCTYCLKKGEEVRDEFTAIVHKTIICKECSEKIRNEKEKEENKFTGIYITDSGSGE